MRRVAATFAALIVLAAVASFGDASPVSAETSQPFLRLSKTSGLGGSTFSATFGIENPNGCDLNSWLLWIPKEPPTPVAAHFLLNGFNNCRLTQTVTVPNPKVYPYYPAGRHQLCIGILYWNYPRDIAPATPCATFTILLPATPRPTAAPTSNDTPVPTLTATLEPTTTPEPSPSPTPTAVAPSPASLAPTLLPAASVPATPTSAPLDGTAASGASSSGSGMLAVLGGAGAGMVGAWLLLRARGKVLGKRRGRPEAKLDA